MAGRPDRPAAQEGRTGTQELTKLKEREGIVNIEERRTLLAQKLQQLGTALTEAQDRAPREGGALPADARRRRSGRPARGPQGLRRPAAPDGPGDPRAEAGPAPRAVPRSAPRGHEGPPPDRGRRGEGSRPRPSASSAPPRTTTRRRRPRKPRSRRRSRPPRPRSRSWARAAGTTTRSSARWTRRAQRAQQPDRAPQGNGRRAGAEGLEHPHRRSRGDARTRPFGPTASATS